MFNAPLLWDIPDKVIVFALNIMLLEEVVTSVPHFCPIKPDCEISTLPEPPFPTVPVKLIAPLFERTLPEP